MQVQVNTDNNIQGREALVERVTKTVIDSLARFSDHVTRVEVHLIDEAPGKTGPHDQRCMMEARLEGFQPLAASDSSSTLDAAVDGAAAKLVRQIDTHLGRVRDRRTPYVEKPGSMAETTEHVHQAREDARLNDKS